MLGLKEQRLQYELMSVLLLYFQGRSISNTKFTVVFGNLLTCYGGCFLYCAELQSRTESHTSTSCRVSVDILCKSNLPKMFQVMRQLLYFVVFVYNE